MSGPDGLGLSLMSGFDIGSRKYLQLSMSVLLGRGSAIIVIGLENQNFIGKLNLEYFFF